MLCLVWGIFLANSTLFNLFNNLVCSSRFLVDILVNFYHNVYPHVDALELDFPELLELINWVFLYSWTHKDLKKKKKKQD